MGFQVFSKHRHLESVTCGGNISSFIRGCGRRQMALRKRVCARARDKTRLEL